VSPGAPVPPLPALYSGLVDPTKPSNPRRSHRSSSDIDLRVTPGDRWAIVGPNGAGKSTLLKALIGRPDDDATVGPSIPFGKVTVKPGTLVGYLEQTAVAGSTRTVRDEVMSRMGRLRKAKTALASAEAAVEGGDYSEGALSTLADAQTEFEEAGGYTSDERVSKVLGGLGFAEADQARLVSSFSGGWQMRVALARLLLSEPELLVLDEPTNHLDAAARGWLARYLKDYPGTLVLVSHDEDVLRSAATSVAEVRYGRLEAYRGRPYDKWLTERVERQQRQQAAYDAQQEEMARLQDFVDRFGAKASKASQAQSRLKQLERLRANAIPAPTRTLDQRAARLVLPRPPPCHTKMLRLSGSPGMESKVDGADGGASLGWDPALPPLVRGVDLTLEKGHVLVVRGPNGAGKSTLMATLSEKLAPLEGEVTKGEGLDLGVFTQDLAQDLDSSMIALDHVTGLARQRNPGLRDEEARTVMGTLGLSGDKAIRPIGQLSGGEKARVALAAFCLVPHTLLLLDEPTNHLDVGTIAALRDALASWTAEDAPGGPGGVVVVSHDRAFCEALPVTHVATVADGVCVVEQRGLRDDDWAYDEEDAMRGDATASVDDLRGGIGAAIEAVATGKAPEVLGPEERSAKLELPDEAAEKAALTASNATTDKVTKPLSAFEQKQLAELEAEVDALATQREALEAALGETAAEGKDTTEAAEALAACDARLSEREARWTALAERA